MASDFIVNNELPQLLSKARRDGTKIMPIVLKPCRFQRDKRLREFQAINNPSTPLVTLSEGEQERIYDKLSEAVEQSLTCRCGPGRPGRPECQSGAIGWPLAVYTLE